MAGYYKLFQSENSKEWYFNLLAGNHQVILSSQGYAEKSSATNGIQSVQKNGVEAERFEFDESSNGKFYFRLKASNGQVIGKSQMYADKEGAQAGVESVMNNATSTEVKEEES